MTLGLFAVEPDVKTMPKPTAPTSGRPSAGTANALRPTTTVYSVRTIRPERTARKQTDTPSL